MGVSTSLPLQRLTDDAASRWNTSQLSINEQLAIAEARASGEHWRAGLLQAQAKGRWVENEVRSATQSMDLNLEWNRVGVDVRDINTGFKYDVLSGTKSNIDTHAKRMSDELFRMITF
jgi:hypothetical protein